MLDPQGGLGWATKEGLAQLGIHYTAAPRVSNLLDPLRVKDPNTRASRPKYHERNSTSALQPFNLGVLYTPIVSPLYLPRTPLKGTLLFGSLDPWSEASAS